MNYVLLLLPIILAFGHDDLPRVPQPQKALRLEAIYDTADYIRALRAENKLRPADRRINPKFIDFRGLLIEENLVKELYPLLPYIFFDSGSATIPERFQLFDNPSQTRQFNDSTIPGGMLQKYYHILNVIGYRLRLYPEAGIAIKGRDSQEPAIEETPEMAKERAKTIYNYLVHIWQIDTGRIVMLRHGNFPTFRSSSRDPLSVIESRRVEILSDDWEIMKPILNTELRRYPQPDRVHFRVENGIGEEKIASQAVLVRHSGRMWHVITGFDTGHFLSEPYNWGKGGDGNILPTNETPFSTQLVVFDKEGNEYRSNEVGIPVMILDTAGKRRELLPDSSVHISTMLRGFFNLDNGSLGPLNERIFMEYVCSGIKPRAEISVTGHMDVVGAEDRNLAGSKNLVGVVEKGIRKHARIDASNSLFCTGVGETNPQYPNDLPEGRFFNRSVRVVVKTPVEASKQ